MSVGRLVKALIPLILIAFGVLWPVVFHGGASASEIDDPVVFADYDVDMVVDDAGDMTAVETLTTEFYTTARHGIFRYWDVANPNSPYVRQKPEVTSVLLDGRPVPYQMLWEDAGRFRVAKIGDPDRYLSDGTHVFEIRYTIPGVLDPGGTGADRQFAGSTGGPDSSPSVFYWNVIAPAWNNRIDRADITVTLPGDIGTAQCSVGFGVGRECDELTVDGNRVQLTAESLPPRTPVTLRVGVDVPTPPRAEVLWPHTWDRVLGRSVDGVAWMVGLTVAFGILALLWFRSVLERSPGFPLQYAPPPGLGPVQAEYIRTESVSKHGLTATLFYLAERNLVALRQVSDEHWEIKGIAEPGKWADVDPVSIAVASRLKVLN
ncbi:DUF2207 domain-containing protein, partial [Mycolicibacterium sp.]|uniref:DUF2207 domain-containing protein n=1 Tax=Mycolicibacterium sp. TaxID=2320850 RepID=UPI003D13D45E